MFKNNYHPAFVMGLVSFTTGIFFLCSSGTIYVEIINSEHFDSDVNSSSNQEIWLFFIGTLIVGLSFIISSIGVMRRSKIARNIVVLLSFLCIVGIIILYGAFMLEVGNRFPQIILVSCIALFFLTMILSIILILTGNDAREYFGEEKLDIHEDLLDNI